MTLIEIPTAFVEKARFVRGIFTDMEKEYDALLHLMTLSLDWVWRRRMFAKMSYSNATTVLDLACGTGLVTFDITKQIRSGFVVGLDPSSSMLSIANEKKHMLKKRREIYFVRATGEFLPFREETFKYATVGLALRNFADKISVFREMRRVLVHLGWFLSVDFTMPQNDLVWRIYRFHIFRVLPILGGLVSAHWKYTLIYLANSILKGASGIENCRALGSAGFRRMFLEQMTLGVVTLIGAQKSARVK